MSEKKKHVAYPQKTHVVGILHNIRSAHNVGSMFRTADAAGIAHLYLTGYTPTPLDRFGRTEKHIEKTALGGEKSVLWSHEASVSRLLVRLRKEGYKLIALETGINATHYRKMKGGSRTALIVGNEVRGLSSATLGFVDMVAEIPMRGKKESLNVAVSFGIGLYELTS